MVNRIYDYYDGFRLAAIESGLNQSVRFRTFSFGWLARNAAAGPVVGGRMFFGLSGHFSKLANIQIPDNRPLEQHFYDPKSAKVNGQLITKNPQQQKRKTEIGDIADHIIDRRDQRAAADRRVDPHRLKRVG